MRWILHLEKSTVYACVLAIVIRYMSNLERLEIED